MSIVNILFILPQIHKGGGQAIQALNLAEQLISKGNKIIILTFKTKKTTKEIKQFLGKIPIYYYKVELNYRTFFIIPSLIKTARKLIKDWKIEVIQSFDPHLSNLFAVILGKLTKLPVICRIGAIHRYFYENKLLNGNVFMKIMYYTKIPSLFLMFMEYFTIRETKVVISNTKYVLKALKQSFFLKSCRFNWKVIPNGVNIRKFSPNKKIPLNISQKFENKEIILYLGRINKFKGIEILVQALARLEHKIPNIHLIIIGSYQLNYNYYKELQKLIKKLNLFSKISFMGDLPHKFVPDYLSLSKCLVFPSYSTQRPFFEGCPSVILETLASKCLVIASKIGGIPEIIQHEKTGLLFEPKNYLELAKLLHSVWVHPIKTQRIVEAGRNLIMRKYAFKHIVENYLKIYEQFKAGA